MAIHSTAIVDRHAEVSADADIGPYAIIEAKARICAGVKIFAHAYICRNTAIGDGTVVHMGAVLGNTPQDVSFERKETYLTIGKRNIIREYATIHRGTKEGSRTVVGDDNFIMATAHVGHNCEIGDKTVIANGALLAGYVKVEDYAFISGNVVIHQFCRIGRVALIGGFSGVNKDVPPYMLVRGPSVVRGTNVVGMRRAKLKKETIGKIKEAYAILFRSGLNTEQAVAKIMASDPSDDVIHLVDFVKASKRGICKYGHENEEVSYFTVPDGA